MKWKDHRKLARLVSSVERLVVQPTPGTEALGKYLEPLQVVAVEVAAKPPQASMPHLPNKILNS